MRDEVRVEAGGGQAWRRPAAWLAIKSILHLACASATHVISCTCSVDSRLPVLVNIVIILTLFGKILEKSNK